MEFDGHAYFMGLLSVFAQGGYLTLVQRSSIEMKKSTLEMIHINGFNTLPFFTVVSMIIMEPIKIAESNSFFGNVANILRRTHTLDLSRKTANSVFSGPQIVFFSKISLLTTIISKLTAIVGLHKKIESVGSSNIFEIFDFTN